MQDDRPQSTDMQRTVLHYPSGWRRKVFIWGVAFWAILLGGRLERKQ